MYFLVSQPTTCWMSLEPLPSGFPSHGRMWAVTSVTVWNGRFSFCTWRQHEGASWNWLLIQKKSLWRSLLLSLCGVALSWKSTSLALTDMTYWQKIHVWPQRKQQTKQISANYELLFMGSLQCSVQGRNDIFFTSQTWCCKRWGLVWESCVLQQALSIIITTIRHQREAVAARG